MQHQWNIPSPSSICQATGRPFEEGESFYTLLFAREEGYERLDLSQRAWEERKKETRAPKAFSFWRSLYERPAEPPAEPITKNDAQGMLRHLLSLEDPKHVPTIYILALMLERKKILKSLPSSHPSLLVYQYQSGGETFLIEDPHLSLENLLAIQHEVAATLASCRS